MALEILWILSKKHYEQITLCKLIKINESFSSSSSSHSSATSSKSSADLDLIAMYEKRNEQLDQDLQRLQQELERAKEILSEVDKHWNNGLPLDLQV